MTSSILAPHRHDESDHDYMQLQNSDDENENVGRPNMQMGLLIGDPWRGSKTKMPARAKPQDQPLLVWHGMVW